MSGDLAPEHLRLGRRVRARADLPARAGRAAARPDGGGASAGPGSRLTRTKFQHFSKSVDTSRTERQVTCRAAAAFANHLIAERTMRPRRMAKSFDRQSPVPLGPPRNFADWALD